MTCITEDLLQRPETKTALYYHKLVQCAFQTIRIAISLLCPGILGKKKYYKFCYQYCLTLKSTQKFI